MDNSKRRVDFRGQGYFAPFAAGLASNNIKIEEVGKEVEMDELKKHLLVPLTEKKEDEIKGEVILNDHYGNSQTNIVPKGASKRFRVVILGVQLI